MCNPCLPNSSSCSYRQSIAYLACSKMSCTDARLSLRDCRSVPYCRPVVVNLVFSLYRLRLYEAAFVCELWLGLSTIVWWHAVIWICGFSVCLHFLAPLLDGRHFNFQQYVCISISLCHTSISGGVGVWTTCKNGRRFYRNYGDATTTRSIPQALSCQRTAYRIHCTCSFALCRLGTTPCTRKTTWNS